MPFQVYWDTPEAYQIVVELLPPLEWSEFHHAIAEAHQKASTIDHNVDIIISVKAKLPSGFALPQFRLSFKNQPPNVTRIIIIVEEKPRMLAFFKQLVPVVRQSFPKMANVVFVSSMDEARQRSIKGVKLS